MKSCFILSLFLSFTFTVFHVSGRYLLVEVDTEMETIPKTMIQDDASGSCCFAIGYGSMMTPCCLQEIDCEEYEQRKNGESVPVLGGAIGKADKCPGDASEAHMIIQKSKAIMKTKLDFSGLLEKEPVCKTVEEKCGFQATNPPMDHGKCCGNLKCLMLGPPHGGVGTCVPDPFPKEKMCPACKMGVGKVESLLKDEPSPEEVKEALTAMCPSLPKEFQDKCKQMIGKGHIAMIIGEIMKGDTPEMICQNMGWCDKTSFPEGELGRSDCIKSGSHEWCGLGKRPCCSQYCDRYIGGGVYGKCA